MDSTPKKPITEKEQIILDFLSNCGGDYIYVIGQIIKEELGLSDYAEKELLKIIRDVNGETPEQQV